MQISVKNGEDENDNKEETADEDEEKAAIP